MKYWFIMLVLSFVVTGLVACGNAVLRQAMAKVAGS